MKNHILPSALRIADTFRLYPEYNKEYTVSTAFECIDNFDKKTIRVKTVEGPIFILDPIKTVYHTGINLEPFRKTFIADQPEYYDLEDCHTEVEICIAEEANAVIRESYAPLHALMSDLFILDERNDTVTECAMSTTDKGCYLDCEIFIIEPYKEGFIVDIFEGSLFFDNSKDIYNLIQSFEKAREINQQKLAA